MRLPAPVLLRAACSAALLLLAPAGDVRAQPLACPAPGDFDCDGVHDLADNCFRIRNTDQRDLDADGEGALWTDRGVYLQGQPVQIQLTAWNGTGAPQTLTFRDSCEAWFVAEGNNGSVVYDRRLHRACFQVITPVTLQPGQSKEWRFIWDQTNDAGSPVRPDDYTLRGFFDGFDPARQASKVISISR